jgi:hypothetical protein
MKMREGLLAAAVIGGTLLFTTGAKAAIVYTYISDKTSYSVAPGGTVTGLIYLKETLSAGSTSLIDGDNGLNVAGFSVTQSSTNLPASPSGVYSIAGSTTTNGSNFTGGSFTEKNTDAANNTYTTIRAGDNATGVSATTGPQTSNANVTGTIEIGSFTIIGGTSGTTTFTLANFRYPSSTGGYTQTVSSDYDLDNSASGATPDPAGVTGAGGAAGAETFTVSVTPEPTSMALLGLGSLGLLARRRKQTR